MIDVCRMNRVKQILFYHMCRKTGVLSTVSILTIVKFSSTLGSSELEVQGGPAKVKPSYFFVGNILTHR